MELAEAIETRHSVRSFLPRPVPKGTIEEILRLAQKTPSWCNVQGWRLIILSGQSCDDFRSALYEHVRSGHQPQPDFAWPQQYYGRFQERRRECGFQLYESVGIPKSDRAATRLQMLENYKLFGAPHAAIVCSEEFLGFYGGVDAGCYLATFMLAARSFGVGCIPQASVAAYAPFIRRTLNIPEHQKIVCGLAFGYPDEGHPINVYRTSREAVGGVAEWRE